MFEDRPWDLYVRDMLEACGRVSEFTDAMDQAGFVADVRTYHATLHNLALIGEAATPHPRVRPRFASRYPLAQHRRREERDHAPVPRHR